MFKWLTNKLGKEEKNETATIITNNEVMEVQPTKVEQLIEENEEKILEEVVAPVSKPKHSRPVLFLENVGGHQKLTLLMPEGKELIINLSTFDEFNTQQPTTTLNGYLTPTYFDKLAEHLGADYDSKTFSLVCTDFVQNCLYDDWHQLVDHLPFKVRTKQMDGGN